MSTISRVMIADDHPMVRGALTLAVATAFGKTEIQESATLDELLEQLGEHGDADLVLLDLRMPGVNGLEGLLAVRSHYPSTPVVVISALDSARLVSETLALGALGFIPKSTPRHEFVEALQRVASGAVYVPKRMDSEPLPAASPNGDGELARRVATLTPQQRKVLQLLGTGKLNKEIAFELEIAETTVKAHVSSILHKMKVFSRTQAVVMAARLSLDRFGDDPLNEREAHPARRGYSPGGSEAALD